MKKQLTYLALLFFVVFPLWSNDHNVSSHSETFDYSYPFEVEYLGHDPEFFFKRYGTSENLFEFENTTDPDVYDLAVAGETSEYTLSYTSNSNSEHTYQVTFAVSPVNGSYNFVSTDGDPTDLELSINYNATSVNLSSGSELTTIVDIDSGKQTHDVEYYTFSWNGDATLSAGSYLVTVKLTVESI